MRLIDADALYAYFKRDHDLRFCGDDFDTWEELGSSGVMYMIKTAPTIDPVKHGHWIPCVVERRAGQMNAMRCSVCDCEELKGSLDADFFLQHHPYCRMCGAKMDMKVEG